MRAREFLIEYAGMDQSFPDLHQDTDGIKDNATFYASIPDTNKKLVITFWNLVNSVPAESLGSFAVIDIAFGIRQPSQFGTNYDPPTDIKGTPQARSNARLMFRILSTVIESLDRYIAEYGTPEAFSFAPATPKLGQLYSRLEPRITKKYGYTPVSLVRLSDIASNVTKDDYHSIFQFFDTQSEYFVRNDLLREYD